MNAASWQRDSSTVPLITAANAAAADAYAIAHGDSPHELMWRAAGHLARGIIAPKTSGYGLRVVIIAGKGNNGGDGYAAALRLTREHGAHATVVALDGHDAAVSHEADTYRRQWLTCRGVVVTGIDAAKAAIVRADVVVDAVLGTGANGPLRGMAAPAVALLAYAKTTDLRLVACDLPTGVDADTGAVAPYTVPVDATVTFGAAKRGLVLAPAATHCGAVTVAPLGEHWDRFVDRLGKETGQRPFVALTASGAAPPAYKPQDDKWSRGCVGILGGAPGMAGAAALAAEGALTCGAGLVSVYASGMVADELAGGLDPAVMLRRLTAQETTASGVGSAAWVTTAHVATGNDVIVAGPGLGVAPGVSDTVGALLSTAKRLVLDADALNVVRDDPSVLSEHAGALVLTPHRKELARIGGGVDSDEAWAQRVTRVPELARGYNATVVAKGPATVIAAPDGRVWVTPVGSPAAGTGGSGDLLAGIIAAAIATTDDVPLAVARAVWWHAWAAERAGEAAAGRATAGSIRRALPQVFRELAGQPPRLQPASQRWRGA